MMLLVVVCVTVLTFCFEDDVDFDFIDFEVD